MPRHLANLGHVIGKKMRGSRRNDFTSAMAVEIAQIRSSAHKYATGAVTATSSCDDIFKEKWDSVKENSHREFGVSEE